METYTLPYAKWIASGSLIYNAGNSKLMIYNNLEGWGGEQSGRSIQERGYICMPMTDSC